MLSQFFSKILLKCNNYMANSIQRFLATCTDGLQNGDETGIDCGGECDACLGKDFHNSCCLLIQDSFFWTDFYLNCFEKPHYRLVCKDKWNNCAVNEAKCSTIYAWEKWVKEDCKVTCGTCNEGEFYIRNKYGV